MDFDFLVSDPDRDDILVRRDPLAVWGLGLRGVFVLASPLLFVLGVVLGWLVMSVSCSASPSCSGASRWSS